MNKGIAWTVAGSDSGGGAGIQADLKTFNSLSVYGASVVTALTAQNTLGVSDIHTVPPSMIRHQLEALATDIVPQAIKIGMVAEKETIQTISDFLQDFLKDTPIFVVSDPVMIATSLSPLMNRDAVSTYIEKILPVTNLLTPNLLEAEVLSGIGIQTFDEVEKAARKILSMGVESVLIKGGHLFHQPDPETPSLCQDYWTDGNQSFWLSLPKINSHNTHGTGCTLSAAITALVARGMDLRDALVVAKAYVHQGIREAPALGKGSGPLFHGGWPDHPKDLPWLTQNAECAFNTVAFPSCGDTPLGLYPIVPRARWVEKILALGVSTLQLRIKDLQGEALETEITEAIQIARAYQARLFINDYWELALRHGAYGVHLGQDDLRHADLGALYQAGLRLGISTHCYREVATAHGVRPSYMAAGPVFPTQTKQTPFAPQGIEALHLWRKRLPNYPLVAVGGIRLDHAPAILRAGVEGIAVVSDLMEAQDLAERIQQWQSVFSTFFPANAKPCELLR